LTTLREKSEVIGLVRKTINETFEAGSVMLWLPVNGHYLPAWEIENPSRQIHQNGALVRWLEREQQLFYSQIDSPDEPTRELQRINGVSAAPLFSGKKLVGILTLSEPGSGLGRGSREGYGQEVLDLLSMLANSTALALENARLYEERVELVRKQFLQTNAIQEEERRRIAQELHDGVGPSLASLNLRLQTVHKQLEREGNPAAGEVAELSHQAQENIHDIRRLIFNLRPAALDKLGLISALEEHLQRFQQDQGIDVILRAPESMPQMPIGLESTLFRITQEALNNVARHACANRVEVCFEPTPAGIRLRVLDDGKGFDPQTPSHNNHLGLWSMQKRVEQYGGQFKIDSVRGSGTLISVLIPIDFEDCGGSC
jgi:signal transduction histidine kinase